MRESARQARDCICREQPECNHSELARLVSGAMWYQDVKLANILIENSDLGREFLEVRGAAIYLNSLSFFCSRKSYGSQAVPF